MQGSAGSGKTTIGLHRIAYLNFAEPGYFRAEDMLVIVHERALAAYVSRVLPGLEVPGVRVQTFGAWAEYVRKSTLPGLRCEITDTTPPAVMRAKSHGAMLAILADRQVALAAWCRRTLAAALADLEQPGDQPERADRERALLAGQTVVGLLDAVAQHQTVLGEFVGDRQHGGPHPRIVGGQEP